jgi:hypothetical protein
MKMHTLNGIKQKARSNLLTLMGDVSQTMRGFTVRSEGTPVTCLCDPVTGDFTWIVSGRFVPEEIAAGVLLDLPPPKEVSEAATIEHALDKFAEWRAAQLVASINAASIKEPGRYEKLMDLSGQWHRAYAGEGGYREAQKKLSSNLKHDQGWVNVLRAQLDTAESACMAISKRFMDEFHRLEEVPA